MPGLADNSAPFQFMVMGSLMPFMSERPIEMNASSHLKSAEGIFNSSGSGGLKEPETCTPEV
jgi:hypothetical protein